MKQEDWYQAKIKKLKRVPVLYIDDFFKGGASDADIKLAFEILNARYNDTALRTIISSEIDLDGLMRIDEAIGGRIYERSRGFAVMAPGENARLT
jgi:DNA replication protein DnaC